VSDAPGTRPSSQAVSRYGAGFALPPLAAGEAARAGPQAWLTPREHEIALRSRLFTRNSAAPHPSVRLPGSASVQPPSVRSKIDYPERSVVRARQPDPALRIGRFPARRSHLTDGGAVLPRVPPPAGICLSSDRPDDIEPAFGTLGLGPDDVDLIVCRDAADPGHLRRPVPHLQRHARRRGDHAGRGAGCRPGERCPDARAEAPGVRGGDRRGRDRGPALRRHGPRRASHEQGTAQVWLVDKQGLLTGSRPGKVRGLAALAGGRLHDVVMGGDLPAAALLHEDQQQRGAHLLARPITGP
jgi:hypothetical protein